MLQKKSEIMNEKKLNNKDLILSICELCLEIAEKTTIRITFNFYVIKATHYIDVYGNFKEPKDIKQGYDFYHSMISDEKEILLIKRELKLMLAKHNLKI